MNLYLSSYKLGQETDKLLEMVSKTNGQVAYIPNALDFSNDTERRRKSEGADIADLESLGLLVERFDLRDYFGAQDAMMEALTAFGVIWVRGGNVFVLRQAMRICGFDSVIKDLLMRKDLVYGGYSSGVCVLAPTLRGFELVDSPSIFPYPEVSSVIWEGLGLLDYSIVPHFESEHRESVRIGQVIRYMDEKKIPFKPLRDGEVIIV